MADVVHTVYYMRPWQSFLRVPGARILRFLVLWTFLISSAGVVLLAQDNAAERYLLAAANRERTARGLPPVVWSATLAHSAAEHARAMAWHRDISHQFEEEPELSERGAMSGARFSLISENVAEAPEPDVIHRMWMESEGHRENLLDPEVDAVGIAVAMRDGQMYAVQDFAKIVQPRTPASQEAKIAGLLAAQGNLQVSSASDEARRACLEGTYRNTKQSATVLQYRSAVLNHLPQEFKQILARGRYRSAQVGVCADRTAYPFSAYRVAILLFP